MRDDIGRLNMPASAKRYARMRGPMGTSAPEKVNLYTQVVGDLVNGGKTKGFKNKDVAVQMEARRIVNGLIDA